MIFIEVAHTFCYHVNLNLYPLTNSFLSIVPSWKFYRNAEVICIFFVNNLYLIGHWSVFWALIWFNGLFPISGKILWMLYSPTGHTSSVTAADDLMIEWKKSEIKHAANLFFYFIQSSTYLATVVRCDGGRNTAVVPSFVVCCCKLDSLCLWLMDFPSLRLLIMKWIWRPFSVGWIFTNFQNKHFSTPIQNLKYICKNSILEPVNYLVV